MSQDYTPFLKWGKYQSRSEKNPDVIEVEVLEPDTFETEYSRNIKARINGTETMLQLQRFGSNNKQLLKIWIKAIKERRIKAGTKFKILTWLDTSKHNKDRDIRRFKFKF